MIDDEDVLAGHAARYAGWRMIYRSPAAPARTRRKDAPMTRRFLPDSCANAAE
jgi:hypothetical protein